MGLDVTAYEQIELVEVRRASSMSEDDWDNLGPDQVWLENYDFPERSSGWPAGIYRASGAVGSEQNSYYGFSSFREAIAAAAHPDLTVADLRLMSIQDLMGVPLGEFIWFSDCEGFLSGPVCARLDKAAQCIPEPKFDTEWYGEKWQNWKNLFALAAGDGAICYT